jgi:alpha-glucoside transport system permease protein
MEQVVSVVITVVVTTAVMVGGFVAVNAILDLAPKRFRLFALFAGAFIGAVVGLLANSGGWLAGGSLWALGGAVVGGLIGAFVWGARPPSEARRRAIVDRIRPIIFLAPAIVFLAIALLIPAIRTIYVSFFDRRSANFIGLDNYRTIFSNEDIFQADGIGDIVSSRLFIAAVLLIAVVTIYMFVRNATTRRGLDFSAPLPVVGYSIAAFLILLAAMSVLRAVIWNNFFWVIFVTALSTIFGLALAVLADRSRGESLAKSLIFMPMAISFVGASIIWRLVYAYTPADSEQIGVMNQIVVAFGGDPVPWIQNEPWNGLLLMAIMIWIQTGFAMVVLSAAIKGVPTELLEAARVDGASEGQIFWRITLPQVRSTLLVVVVTVVMTVLKVYDIVKVMTNGQFGTEVIANRMFNTAFINRDYGEGSALAVLLFVAVLPLMIANVRRTRKEAA